MATERSASWQSQSPPRRCAALLPRTIDLTQALRRAELATGLISFATRYLFTAIGFPPGGVVLVYLYCTYLLCCVLLFLFLSVFCMWGRTLKVYPKHKIVFNEQ